MAMTPVMTCDMSSCVSVHTQHKHPSWHRGESVRFLFLNPLPLLLGIQELPVPNKFLLIPPIFFWAIYSQNLRKFLSSKCRNFLQVRVLLEFSSAFPPAPSVSSVIFTQCPNDGSPISVEIRPILSRTGMELGEITRQAKSRWVPTSYKWGSNLTYLQLAL